MTDKPSVNHQFPKTLLTGVLLVNLLMAALVWLSLQNSKTHFGRQAAVTTRNISQVLDENISGIFSRVDLCLQAVADEAEHQLASGGIREDGLNSFIIRQHSRLPELLSFRATNAAGDAIYGPKGKVAKTISLAHRDYFSVLRDRPDVGLVISKPVVGGISGKQMIVLARRINRPDGGFAGLVYAGLSMEYLTKSFSAPDIGADGAITLLDADLSIVARYPELKRVETEAGIKKVSQQLSDLIKSGKTTATYRAKYVTDGIERISSYRRISHKQTYYIVTGLSVSDYLAHWRTEVLKMCLFWISACIFTVLSAMFLYKKWHKTREAELAVLKSDQRFRQFVENANELIYTLSPDGIITYVAPNVESLLGYHPTELTGTQFQPLIHQDELPACLLFLQEIMKAGIKQSGLEFRIRHKNGNWLWFVSNASIITDVSSGEPFFLGIGHDITDRKKVEAALLESEEKHRILLEESSDSIFSLTPQGRYIYVNPAFAKGVDRPREEIIGHSLWDIFPKDDADSRFAAVSRVCTLGRAEEIEVRVSCGVDDRYFMTMITPIKDITGDVFTVICSSRDITRLKNTENTLREMASLLEDQKHELMQINETLEQRVMERTEELQEINSRFMQLAEHGRTAVWEVNADGLYTYISTMSESLYGLHPDNVVGQMHFYEMFPPSEREAIIASAFDIFNRKEAFVNFEHGSILSDQNSNNRRILISSSGIPLLGEDGTLSGYRGTDTDISESRRIQEMLNHSQKLDAIGQLTGGIAHDFNNKLMIILGYASLAEMDIDNSTKVLGYLDGITNAANQSRQMTIQLLGFSRQQVTMPVVLDVNSSIEETKKTLPRLIGENISFIFKQGEDLWNIRIDPVQLDQVIMNMAVNARDAMPDGGSFTVETSNATFDAERCKSKIDMNPGDYVCISFSDTGTGIEPEILEHIFEPFFTTKELGKGTGLGLATIHGIVSQNGGVIEVASSPGAGTSFTVCFPRHDAVPENSAGEDETLTHGSGSILLVEDEGQLREMAAIFLRKIGYTVYAFGNPAKALETASDSSLKLDLVLTDVVMPEMNGIELVERIREMRPEIKAFFVSGYSSNHAALGAVANAENFMQKPYKLNKLSEMLDKALS